MLFQLILLTAYKHGWNRQVFYVNSMRRAQKKENEKQFNRDTIYVRCSPYPCVSN